MLISLDISVKREYSDSKEIKERNMLMKKIIKRVLTIVTAMALVLTGLCFSDQVNVKAADPTGKKIVVSLGDSYSSGEGIEPFFGQDKPSAEKVEDEDWLAHRSEKAWSGMLTIDGQSLVKDDNWFFAAASGAETVDLYGNQNKYYDLDGHKGNKGLTPQLEIFDVVEKKYGSGAVDFVTISIGGNDVGFTDIMTAAIMNPDHLDEKLDQTWDYLQNEHTINGKKVPAIKDAIKQNYKDIAEKAGKQAAIIVAGYPNLFNPDGFSVLVYTVSSETAQKVNDWTVKFNDVIKNVVDECSKEGLNISFVPVAEAFRGHEAYTSEPYINEIKIGRGNQDIASGMISSYSLHPNEKGAAAYAKEVQKAVDSIIQASDNSNKGTDKDNENGNTTKETAKPDITLSSKKGKITIKWDKVEDAKKYKVIEYINGKAKTVKSTKKTSISIKGRTKGTEYTFAVKAYVNGKWTKITSSDKKTITVK